MQVLRALKQGFGTDILVSPDMYKQAAHNWGDPTRLHRFFRKLLRGVLNSVSQTFPCCLEGTSFQVSTLPCVHSMRSGHAPIWHVIVHVWWCTAYFCTVTCKTMHWQNDLWLIRRSHNTVASARHHENQPQSTTSTGAHCRRAGQGGGGGRQCDSWNGRPLGE